MKPLSRPITSTIITRRCDSAVSIRRSQALSTASTAVSNPIVASVPATSRSIVFGTPTTAPRRISGAISAACVKLPFPPTTITPSSPARRTPSAKSAASPRKMLSQPRIDPPRRWIRATRAGSSRRKSDSTSPR